MALCDSKSAKPSAYAESSGGSAWPEAADILFIVFIIN